MLIADELKRKETKLSLFMARQYSGGESFNKLAMGYDFMDSLHNNNDYFIERMPDRRELALDIGCGTGIVAQALANYFGKVVGIDISNEMLSIARNKRTAPNIEYLEMDAETVYPGTKYDYIVSRTTFHHIRDVPAMIEKLKSMTNSGGRIAILDCTYEKGSPSIARNIAVAYLSFAFDAGRIGFKNAARIFSFRISRPWLEHLASDKYPTKKQFTELYERCLPGCTIEREKCFMGVVWENR